MTAFERKAGVVVALAVSALALAACGATSQYAPYEGYQTPAPREAEKPKFPVSEANPSQVRGQAMDQAQPAPAEPASAPKAAPTASVTSGELRPILVSQTEEAPASSPRSAAPAMYQAQPRQSARPAADDSSDEDARPAARSSRSTPAPASTQTKTVVTVAGKVVDAAGPPVEYEVKKGDTVYGVARKLKTTGHELAVANGLKEPFKIKPGQTLKGPATKAKAYVVQNGDTLYAIARRFSVEAKALADLNDMEVGSSLRAGRKIVLPAKFKDKGPTKREVTVATSEPAPSRPSRPAPSSETPAREPQTREPQSREPQSREPEAREPVREPEVRQPPVRETPRETAPVRTQPPVTAPAPTSPGPHPYQPSSPAPGTPRPQILDTSPPPTDAEVLAAGRGRFIWPVRGDIISGFGSKGGGQRNDGVNIAGEAGDSVRAAAAGEVVYAGNQVPGFGNLVLIKHANGFVTAYAHLGSTSVKIKDQIAQGQQVGTVGQTGGVDRPQLHFEVRYAAHPSDKAKPVDPQILLR